jgi:hypothetical protein
MSASVNSRYTQCRLSTSALPPKADIATRCPAASSVSTRPRT